MSDYKFRRNIKNDRIGKHARGISYNLNYEQNLYQQQRKAKLKNINIEEATKELCKIIGL